jgi:hypothetical protein
MSVVQQYSATVEHHIQLHSFEIIDCWFSDCESGDAENGGAISCSDNRSNGFSNITNCAFVRCRTSNAQAVGGAFYDWRSTLTIFTHCCAYYCDGNSGGFYYCSQTSVPAIFHSCSISRCSPLTGAFSRCSGGGAVFDYGSASISECNFTGNLATYGGADLWSYCSPASVAYCLFNGGNAPFGMVYSVYQGNVVNISASSFLNSSSPTFHSQGSTRGSLIIARHCFFKDVGGFDCYLDSDAVILLIECEFSNASVWTVGSVTVGHARLNVTRTVIIAPLVVDRECPWYGLASTSSPTSSKDERTHPAKKKFAAVAVGVTAGVLIFDLMSKAGPLGST